MISHFEFLDAKFEHQFASAQLGNSLFTLEAQLSLEYINIINYEVKQAISNIPEQLYRYVSNLGAKDKCNKTLTFAE